MANIIKIRLDVQSASYSEIGHLRFYKNDEPLEADRNGNLTLKDGSSVKMSFKANSAYSGFPANYAIWDKVSETAACANCWCSAGYGGVNWWECEFDKAVPSTKMNKITFCCGQGHGSYPSTFTLTLFYDNGKQRVIGEPLYVNAHNGIFEWKNYLVLVKKKDKYFYKKATE